MRALLLLTAAAACGGAGDRSTTSVSAPAPAPASAPAPPPPAASHAPALLPAPLPGDPTRTTIHRLSNGMTVYLSPDPQAPSVSARIAVRAGGAQDPAHSTGLAHYLEHMMLFKGTSKLGTIDYAKEKPHLDRIAALYAELRRPGADRERVAAEIDAETQRAAAYAIPNESYGLYARLGILNHDAYTDYDLTVYFAEVPRNRLAQWARVETARFSDPVFRLFWPELEVIYEEKNRGMDDPARRIHEAFHRAMFPSWTSGLGEIEHLKVPAYGDMVAFYERYYTPANMAIVLAGDVDASVLPLLERELGALRRPAGAAAPPPAPPRLAGRTAVRVTVPEDGVVLGWPLVPATHPDRLALEVMDLLLADGRSGLIARELLIPQRVADAGSTASFLREYGWLQLRADALAGQPHAEVERLLHGLVGKLQRGEFTDEDLAAAILSLEIADQQQAESNAARAIRLEQAFATGEAWRDVASRIARMKQLRKEDLVRVARRYLGPGFVALEKVKGQAAPAKLAKPKITPVKLDPARQSSFAREILALPVTPLEPVALAEGRDYERGAVPAGELVTVVNRRNELFALELAYESGRADDRALCLALDLLQVAGAAARSADEVARRLHVLGLSLETECAIDRSSIKLSGIDRNLPAGVALLRELLASPRADAAAVGKLVATELTERETRAASPDVIAEAQRQLAWYDARSDHKVVASNAELRAVTPARLAGLLARLLGQQRRTSYFGPRARADVVAAIAPLEGKLPARPPRALRYRGAGAVLATAQETAQTHVWLAWPRGPTSDADRAACELAETYLGYRGKLLFQEIRETRGLAYIVFGGCYAGGKQIDHGRLYAYAGTQADKVHEAIDAMLAALRRPIEPARFGVARDAIEQHHRAERIPPREIASHVYRWQDEGARADPRAERVRRALAVDMAALERWLAAALGGRMLVSITGERKPLDDARLRRLGPVTWVPVPALFGY